MTATLNIGLAQIDPTVGDVAGNLELIIAAHAKGAKAGCDLVVCPELVMSGYPPEDLVLKPIFIDAVESAVARLAAVTEEGPALLVGAPWRLEGSKATGSVVPSSVVNGALLLADGILASVTAKHHLPNYGVFDEMRVFAPGPLPEPMAFKGVKLGVMVCEDMWRKGPAAALKDHGADILIVINGSPFESDKLDERLALARQRVTETGLGLVYVNQVGGQDELVFDGAGFVLGPDGGLRARLQPFKQDFATLSWTAGETGLDTPEPEPEPETETETETAGPDGDADNPIPAIYKALVLGLRDYVNKNGFPGVLIGLSGGIDSALSALVAADALGAERVHCVMMPSPYTSDDSLEDAAALAQAVGMKLDTISIEPAMAAFDGMLDQAFAGRDPDTTEENIQARARGLTLMALSNKFGHMVLSTGNK